MKKHKSISGESKQSRRDFLKKTSAAIAGAAFVPTILPSCGGWKGANDMVNVAHIGVGSRGTATLYKYFLPSTISRSIAICDAKTKNRTMAAEKTNAYYKEALGWENDECKAYLDYEEILARPDIDAVQISTGDHWHLPMAIRAARAGKHIYLEKPLGLNYKEMLILQEECAKRDLVFQYGTQARSMSHAQKAIEMVRSGRLGKIEKLDVNSPGNRDRYPAPGDFTESTPEADGVDYDRWLGPAPYRPYSQYRVHYNSTWWVYDYSLGWISGWGAHLLDEAVWGVGEQMNDISVHRGTGSFWPEGLLYDTISDWDNQIEFRNGLKIHFLSGSAYTVFYGEKGYIKLGRGHFSTDIPELYNELKDDPTFDKYDEKKNMMLFESETGQHGVTFIKAIKGEIKPVAPLADAILSDAVSHMGNISIRTGNEIEWDPVQGKILNHPEYMKLHFERESRAPYGI